MALPGNKDFNEYDNFVTDSNPTTSAQARDYFRNQAELLKAVIDCDFWQPETVYQPGDVVKSDSMPNGTEAVMVATKASVTSNVEPSWGDVGGANISDGACFWKLRWQHWSKEVASADDMKSGTSNDKLVTPNLARLGQTATNRLPDTTYSVGNVVYVDSNLSVALKCAQAGTTSNTELDISTKNIGDTVTDGSVIWQVCNRTSDVTSVNGKTGDVVVDTLPVGTIISYAGNTTPNGFLDCNGASLNPATYTKLFNEIGTTYGGDGSTTFNLPNLQNGKIINGDEAYVYGTARNASFAYFILKNDDSAGGTYNYVLGQRNYNGSNFSVLSDSTSSFGEPNIYTKLSDVGVSVKYCIKY